MGGRTTMAFMQPIVLCIILVISFATAQTCPAPTKKTAIIGTQANLPEGFVVYGILAGAGIYCSPLQHDSAFLIPNTKNDSTCSNLAVSSDGKWLVYNSAMSVFVIGIDAATGLRFPLRT
jgi:hypothetical protein